MEHQSWAVCIVSDRSKSRCLLSHFSRVRYFATPWTVAHQAFLSMGFSSQEYWSGLFLPPGDLPNPGIKPGSLSSPALAGGFFTTNATWEALKVKPNIQNTGAFFKISMLQLVNPFKLPFATCVYQRGESFGTE